MKHCQLCHKRIKDPIRPERVLQQINQWLHQSAPYLADSMPAIQQTLPINYEIRKDQRCVHSENEVKVCPSCTVDHAEEWLQTLNAPEGVLKRYNELFSYNVIGRKMSQPVTVPKPLKREKPLQTNEIPEYL